MVFCKDYGSFLQLINQFGGVPSQIVMSFAKTWLLVNTVTCIVRWKQTRGHSHHPALKGCLKHCIGICRLYWTQELAICVSWRVQGCCSWDYNPSAMSVIFGTKPQPQLALSDNRVLHGTPKFYDVSLFINSYVHHGISIWGVPLNSDSHFKSVKFQREITRAAWDSGGIYSGFLILPILQMLYCGPSQWIYDTLW